MAAFVKLIAPFGDVPIHFFLHFGAENRKDELYFHGWYFEAYLAVLLKYTGVRNILSVKKGRRIGWWKPVMWTADKFAF